ncbi:MAG: porin [Gammaproteobacteria bacterium]|nr:porin [Gammaproteobacteria bacterium]
MKFKTSAIALAVAGVVAAPMAAQADIYASARVGVENVDTGGVSDLRMRSFGSRFGAKSETDLGNGMTGFGRFEWDVDFKDHNEDVNTADADGDDVDLRHRYVGIKGDFGSITIGQTYHTFYNHVVGPLDNPWWASGYAMVNYNGRQDGAVTYAGGTGAMTFGASLFFLREAEEDKPDEIELGASFGIGDMTLGVALQNVASDRAHGSAGTDDDIIGVALSGISFGSVSMGFGYQQQHDDSSILADLGIGNAYVHVELGSFDASSTASFSGDDEDHTLVTVGYTQSLGRKTTAWYEVVSYDADSGNSDDDATILRGVLKYDIE